MRSGVFSRFVLVLLVAGLTTGCFGKREMKKCHKEQEYQQAKPGPRVRVPDDMQQLPEDERLRYPYGETRTTPIPKSQPCLEEPPTF